MKKNSNSGNSVFAGRSRIRPAALVAACALALACVGGLAACGGSASEPGGTSAAPATSAEQSADANTSDQGAGSAATSGEGASADAGSGSQEAGSASESSASDDSTHGDSLDADKALEGQTNAHPVQFTISAPGYSDSDGKIPIAIAGTRVDGTAVDATAYLDASGNGLSLSPGQYTVTVIESPLMSGGKFFRAPGKSWDVIVGDTLASGESVSVDGTISFSEMDLSELTKDEVNTAYTYAVSGGLAENTAKQYKKELLEAAGLS